MLLNTHYEHTLKQITLTTFLFSYLCLVYVCWVGLDRT
ncbi:MAG: hypothetical protein AVDCRST_MAG37-2012 [uncultured Rubrobacteraceae bacterium]|uniref:Uncharacterized protein n=1 Tax=uncultured Rubrobacteraceae bacterium TaxID=349277 RepID=A0A6J4QS12_9ACTN|nr:MAG: hypothetical protein AVDCRST_MAG37-2012 [uncultured Rubrobacteraceae bacterium]